MLLVSDDFGQASLPGLWANSGSVSVLSSGFESPLANPPVFPRRVKSRPPRTQSFNFLSLLFSVKKWRAIWFGQVPKFLSNSILSVQLLSGLLQSRAPGQHTDHCPLLTFSQTPKAFKTAERGFGKLCCTVQSVSSLNHF